jgi:hypothetical protein
MGGAVGGESCDVGVLVFCGSEMMDCRAYVFCCGPEELFSVVICEIEGLKCESKSMGCEAEVADCEWKLFCCKGEVWCCDTAALFCKIKELFAEVVEVSEDHCG